MRRKNSIVCALALICGLSQLVDATPFGRADGGMRIPFRPSRKADTRAGSSLEGRARAPDFTWGREPMRGVNIGGWLVLEPWITPSLFEGKPDWVVDEYTYGAYMSSRPDPMAEIRHHWNTWFQYYELENIASVGLNTIRIQIGFWSLIPLINGEPFMVGAFEYLKLAVTWAQGLNLKNGFDNSGLRSVRQWTHNQTNMDRTIEALRVLTEEFTDPTYGDTIVAVELLNEPFPQQEWEVDFLKRFYQSAYSTVRQSAKHPGVVVAIDEAFQGLREWDGFMTEPQWTGVALDTHIYSMFNLDTLQLGYNANLQWYCSQINGLAEANKHHWTIVGEFTPAHTDCARWLNGRGAGARFDNTLPWSKPVDFKGDCSLKTGPDGSKFGADYVDYLARSFETQTWVYETAGSGYIQWTWKTEEASDWSMSTGITYGWIPTPITAKPHGTPCNFSSAHAEPTPSAESSAGRNAGLTHGQLLFLTILCVLLGVWIP